MIKKRRHVTLIEMMIVMSLIVMIIGVIAYNYQGSLEKGKAFKTEAGMEKVKTILSLAIAENPDATGTISTGWKDMIKSSSLVRDPETLLKDGWGNEYQVSAKEDNGETVIEVVSTKYNSYISKQKGGQKKG